MSWYNHTLILLHDIYHMSFVFLIGQIDEQIEVRRLTRGMLPFTQPSGLMPTTLNYVTLCFMYRAERAPC